MRGNCGEAGSEEGIDHGDAIVVLAMVEIFAEDFAAAAGFGRSENGCVPVEYSYQ